MKFEMLKLKCFILFLSLISFSIFGGAKNTYAKEILKIELVPADNYFTISLINNLNYEWVEVYTRLNAIGSWATTFYISDNRGNKITPVISASALRDTEKDYAKIGHNQLIGERVKFSNLKAWYQLNQGKYTLKVRYKMGGILVRNFGSETREKVDIMSEEVKFHIN